MRRIGTWAAAMVLGAGALAGCGGDDDSGSDAADSGFGDDSYCDKLVQYRDTLQNTSDAESFTEFRAAAGELADDAPPEVSGEWEKIEGAFDQLEDRLKEAGLSIDDLDDPSALESADPATIAKLQEDLTAISQDIDGAGDKISEHAKSECGIDLGGTDTPSPSS